jgi:hypothetical protein
VSAIIACVDKEIAVAGMADVIGCAGDLAPGIQVQPEWQKAVAGSL